MTSLRILLLAALLAVAHSAPAPAPAPAPSQDDRPEIIEIIAPAASAQETLDSLNLGEPGSELSERNKRTIGILRQLFPTLTQIVEQKIQNITGSLFQTFGPLILNALSGSRNNNNNNGGVDTFDDDDDDDEDVETITKAPIKYAPDAEKVPNTQGVSLPEPIERLRDGTTTTSTTSTTTTTSTEESVILPEDTNNVLEDSKDNSTLTNNEMEGSENVEPKSDATIISDNSDVSVQPVQPEPNTNNTSTLAPNTESPIEPSTKTNSETADSSTAESEPKLPPVDFESELADDNDTDSNKRKRKRYTASN